MKRSIFALIAFVVLVSPLQVMAGPAPDKENAPLVLTDISGKETDISAVMSADKRPVLLFFWTSWCPFCLKELRQLGRREQELGTSVDLFVVNAGEDKATVERVARNYKLDVRIFLDEKMSVAERYGVIGVPTFVLIDHGNVVSNGNSFPESDLQKVTRK